MSQLRFDLSRRALDELSGFDLGDLTVTGPLGVHTSSGKQPDQSMMIYLAIPLLIFGTRDLLCGARNHFDFVGPDSSYSLKFARKGNNVALSAAGRPLGNVTMAELLHAISRGVHGFLGVPENQLPPDDAADEDLQASLRALDDALRTHG